MKINKKLKCVHCGDIVECTESHCVKVCSCGKVSLNGEIITEGALGKDYVDVSPKLLNE
jgi:hypothetical protein